jgi:hypothetical protein
MYHFLKRMTFEKFSLYCSLLSVNYKNPIHADSVSR